MKTQILTENALLLAKDLLSKGDLVAIPTETVYGLAANALDPIAIKKIYVAKGRPSDNPLIIHISSLEMLSKLVKKELSYFYSRLINDLWPGPLTLLFPKSDLLPSIVTGGSDTMAIRMPSCKITLELIELCGFPLAAPSANTSGRPSPTQAMHVFNDLNGKIPLIIDGGSCSCGIESTVVNGLLDPPILLRPGGISLETLQKYDSRITQTSNSNIPTTPGMKYKHYTPNVPVILIEENGDQASKFQSLLSKYQGKRIGILSTQQSFELGNDSLILHLHLGNSFDQIAQGLFNGLLYMEGQDLSVLIVQGISEKETGLGIMNRLRKAASEIV
jgi:L-threonylcarbamoyladenylate synthase